MLRERKFSLDSQIEFYRQPGGCLEIWQFDEGTEKQDIIHLCNADGDLPTFVSELLTFAKDTEFPFRP